MKFSRLAVILLPIILWLLAQLYFIWPGFFYLSLGLSAVLILISTFFIKTPERRTPWWLLAILPLSFLLSITVYASLQANWILVQVLFVVLLIFIFNYFKSLYYFWHRTDLYNENDSSVINAYGGFLIIFFLAADLFGLQSLLNLTVWPMFLIFSSVVFGITYLNLNIDPENFGNKAVWQFSVINTLLIAEMTLVFIFLPLSYNISALSVGIVYYLFVNITRLHLQKALTPKKIKLYLIISYAGLAILLLTARWLN